MHASRLALVLLLAVPLLPGSAWSGGPDDAVIAAAEKALQNADWQQRLKALDTLEPLKGPKVEKALLGYLKDLDWSVQSRACQVAEKVGATAVEEALLDLVIEGEIHRVREAAIQALAKRTPAAAAERLLKRARTGKKTFEKVRALEASGRLAAPDLVAKYREYANHREAPVAAAAARALGWVGRDPAARVKALDLLEDLLSRRDVRDFGEYSAAIESLMRLDDPEARSRLVREALRQPDEDPYVVTRVGRALAAAGPEAAATAWRAHVANAKDATGVRRLVRLAAEARLAPVRDAIEGWAAHADPLVRSEAARALGLLADPLLPNHASLPVLVARLADEEERVRVEAVGALARVEPREAFRARAAALRKDASVEVRMRFLVDVTEQGEAAGIAALQPFLGDEDWRIASAAAAAIGTLGISTDMALLQPLVDHRDWKIRAAAFEGLARLRAGPAIPLLAKGLTDKDPLVRGVCLASLQILSKKQLGTKPDRWLDWFEKEGRNLTLIKRSRRTKADIEAEIKKEQEEDAKVQYGHEKDELSRAREARKRSVEILQKARILVVTGAWDHVERVLEHLTIPHTLLRAQELQDAGINPNQVILVNCEGTVDKDAIERLRWFVNVGGYLMTTDWALTHTVEPCFPGYVKQFSGSSTGNDVVVVEEGRPGHPWTKGIFDDVPALKWWLEIQAFPISVAYPERCEVLVDSAEMRRKYGSSTMAVEFRWGLGRVQHSISHFALQEEGMQQTNDVRQRAIFAADNLGISLAQVRNLVDSGRLAGQLNEETMKEIAPDYSMFRLIVHVVREKALWVANL